MNGSGTKNTNGYSGNDWGIGRLIVDVCLVAQQIEMPVRGEGGVLSIIWRLGSMCHGIATSVLVEAFVSVCFADQSQTPD